MGRFDPLVPGEGLEPSQCHHRRILSPLRLPIPPSRPGCGERTIRALAEEGRIMRDSDRSFNWLEGDLSTC